jgi:hypothetical protein
VLGLLLNNMNVFKEFLKVQKIAGLHILLYLPITFLWFLQLLLHLFHSTLIFLRI